MEEEEKLMFDLLVLQMRKMLKELPVNIRGELMHKLQADFCTSCWDADPTCQCGNDE